MSTVRALAINLPQFHPIPENDAWWGEGFTEWTNVSSARALFPGHDQPRVPTDLGYYDLRRPEVRAAQAALARDAGFDGFCYYHYWFHGHRLLDQPVREIRATGEPDFPFCLFWANESWSRTWLGLKTEILLSQNYSPEDNREHARHLAAVFTDPRYVRVGGRPLFVIYRPGHLGELLLGDFVEALKGESVAAGAGEPMILGCSAWSEGYDMRAVGLDGTLDFQPKLSLLPGAFADDDPDRQDRNRSLGVESPTLRLYDDASWRSEMAAFRDNLPYPVYPSVVVSWDNTPRRGEDGIVVLPRGTEGFERGLRDALRYLSDRGDQLSEPVVFVNAWNEWAEGNYLEPDQSSSRASLDVCRTLLR